MLKKTKIIRILSSHKKNLSTSTMVLDIYNPRFFLYHVRRMERYIVPLVRNNNPTGTKRIASLVFEEE